MAAVPSRARSPRHPSYNTLIMRILEKAPTRKGSSLHAIRKSIQDKYKLPDSCRRHIRLAIRRCLRMGLITHGNSTQMYKLCKGARSKKMKVVLRSSSKKGSPAATPAGSPAISPPPSPKSVLVTKIAKAPKKISAPTPKPSLAKAAKPFVWQYTDDSGRFQYYDVLASDTVEECYEEYLKNPHMMDVRAVRSGDWQYQVDFLQMKQTNILHQNHRVRTIRRIANPAISA